MQSKINAGFAVKAILLVIGIFTGSSSIVKAAGDTLFVGCPAPPLKVFKWIKGKPVNGYEKGRTYFVEFGFVSCAACRDCIPHLSEMQDKYPDKLSVVSAFIWENGPSVEGNNTDTVSAAYVPRVEKFIRNMGSNIRYTVAVDDPRQTLARTWMNPAGMNGAPTAFIVNGYGIVVWIGNPAAFNMKTVLKEAIDGNLDTKKAIADQWQEWRVRYGIVELREKGEYEKAIQKSDSLIEKYPSTNDLYFIKFMTLYAFDLAKANAYARRLLDHELHDCEPWLYDLADQLSNPLHAHDTPDNDLVLDITARALELCKDSMNAAFLYRMQGITYFRKGEREKGKAQFEKSISLFKNIHTDFAAKMIKNTIETMQYLEKSGH
jgi:thiol-disulfide isomerase/thioredoxin